MRTCFLQEGVTSRLRTIRNGASTHSTMANKSMNVRAIHELPLQTYKEIAFDINYRADVLCLCFF
ncbi:MAG: hypothetical protein KGJ87_00875 [Planctomycetota bacterium]|nr:hypothetical protein [Planctomycetota bacterium]MDE2215708.1 hypothetical protein [Planctomycetota bacterium]